MKLTFINRLMRLLFEGEIALSVSVQQQKLTIIGLTKQGKNIHLATATQMPFTYPLINLPQQLTNWQQQSTIAWRALYLSFDSNQFNPLKQQLPNNLKAYQVKQLARALQKQQPLPSSYQIYPQHLELLMVTPNIVPLFTSFPPPWLLKNSEPYTSSWYRLFTWLMPNLTNCLILHETAGQISWYLLANYHLTPLTADLPQQLPLAPQSLIAQLITLAKRINFTKFLCLTNQVTIAALQQAADANPEKSFILIANCEQQLRQHFPNLPTNWQDYLTALGCGLTHFLLENKVLGVTPSFKNTNLHFLIKRFIWHLLPSIFAIIGSFILILTLQINAKQQLIKTSNQTKALFKTWRQQKIAKKEENQLEYFWTLLWQILAKQLSTDLSIERLNSDATSRQIICFGNCKSLPQLYHSLEKLSQKIPHLTWQLQQITGQENYFSFKLTLTLP